MNKLNILIANGEMENFFGGTQTWTITMVKYLRRLGHNVHFTGATGKLNILFKEDFQPLYSKYDILISNGNIPLKKFSKIAPVKIMILHGILPKMEQPVKGADILLGVSEEVKDYVESKGFKCDGVLRNPIDLEKFKTSNEVKEIKTIGFLDRRRKFPFLNEVKKYYNVHQIGHPPTTKIKEELDKCDLVVARGRGIYEAMALGKNAIVSGNNSGRGGSTELMDGFIDDETFYDFRMNNCSGRRNKIKVTSAEMFLEEVKKASLEQGHRNRVLMEKNNEAGLIAETLLNYYDSYINKIS